MCDTNNQFPRNTADALYSLLCIDYKILYKSEDTIYGYNECESHQAGAKQHIS